MRAFGKLAFVQAKLYLRDPMGIFFTLLFGPLLLVMIGLVFGNEPQAILGGRGQMDISVPAYVALIIGITGLTTVPITAAGRRELGVLRRFSVTPLRPLTYFLADALAPFVFTLLGLALLLLVGRVAYHVRFEGQWLSFIVASCLSMGAFFALGYALAGIVPNARIATLIGNVLIIPMNFLSGALVPMEVMPAAVRSASRLIPLTHVVTLLQGVWFAEGLGAHLLEVGVLAGMLVLGMVVVAFTFRWE